MGTIVSSMGSHKKFLQRRNKNGNKNGGLGNNNSSSMATDQHLNKSTKPTGNNKSSRQRRQQSKSSAEQQHLATGEETEVMPHLKNKHERCRQNSNLGHNSLKRHRNSGKLDVKRDVTTGTNSGKIGEDHPLILSPTVLSSSLWPGQSCVIFEFNCGIDDKDTVLVEKNSVLKYRTPYFRAFANVQVPPVDEGKQLIVGWIQVVRSMTFVNLYGEYGITSWEFPEIATGKQRMISDSDGHRYPWYGARKEISSVRGPKATPTLLSVSMNDNFSPQVTWHIPAPNPKKAPRDPRLTRVYRQQTFTTCLAIMEIDIDSDVRTPSGQTQGSTPPGKLTAIPASRESAANSADKFLNNNNNIPERSTASTATTTEATTAFIVSCNNNNTITPTKRLANNQIAQFQRDSTQATTITTTTSKTAQSLSSSWSSPKFSNVKTSPVHFTQSTTGAPLNITQHLQSNIHHHQRDNSSNHHHQHHHHLCASEPKLFDQHHQSDSQHQQQNSQQKYHAIKKILQQKINQQQQQDNNPSLQRQILKSSSTEESNNSQHQQQRQHHFGSNNNVSLQLDPTKLLSSGTTTTPVISLSTPALPQLSSTIQPTESSSSSSLLPSSSSSPRKIMVLRAVDWSMEVEIAVQPSQPVGSRARLLRSRPSPICHKPEVIADDIKLNKVIDSSALLPPNANRSQVLVWRPFVTTTTTTPPPPPLPPPPPPPPPPSSPTSSPISSILTSPDGKPTLLALAQTYIISSSSSSSSSVKSPSTTATSSSSSSSPVTSSQPYTSPGPTIVVKPGHTNVDMSSYFELTSHIKESLFDAVVF